MINMLVIMILNMALPEFGEGNMAVRLQSTQNALRSLLVGLMPDSSPSKSRL